MAHEGTDWDFEKRYGPFKVAFRWTGEERGGKDVLEYALWDDDWDADPVFQGDDFGRPGIGDDEWSAIQLLGFLSLELGDTDKEYFANYTPYQLKWRDARASDLKMIQTEAEEKALEKRRRRA